MQAIVQNTSHTLSPGEVFFVFGEYFYFFISIIAMVSLVLCRCMGCRWMVAYVIGIVLGLMWEVSHSLLGDNFLTLVNPVVYEYIPKWIYPILHAGADGTIFVAVFATVVKCMIPMCFKKSRILNVEQRMTFFPCVTLGLMVSIYFLQELLVELVFNSKVWIYGTNISWNPTLFRIGDVGYTLIPLVEWVVFGFIYWITMYFVFFRLKCSKCDKHNRYNPIFYGQPYYTTFTHQDV